MYMLTLPRKHRDWKRDVGHEDVNVRLHFATYLCLVTVADREVAVSMSHAKDIVK